MPHSTPSVVCDAGGVLVVAGALVGMAPAAVEVLAPDWTSITVGSFLAAHHEGKPEQITSELARTLSSVDEWFPVRSIVAETMERAGPNAVDALDSCYALVLAEQPDLPLFTASDEVASERVEIHRPW